MGDRSQDLPAKFNAAERRAYQWLWDCNIRPWVVDLLTKKVKTPSASFKSLLTFAASHGWKDE